MEKKIRGKINPYRSMPFHFDGWMKSEKNGRTEARAAAVSYFSWDNHTLWDLFYLWIVSAMKRKCFKN
jgi:hypothetical protein